MTRTSIPRPVLDFQKQILDFQRNAFESGYDAIVALQERQIELADRMMNQVPNLPDEARELVETWRGAAADSQRQFKRTIDGSFDAVTEYLDRLAAGPADDEADAQPPSTAEAPEETDE